jgi:hypothetical protein
MNNFYSMRSHTTTPAALAAAKAKAKETGKKTATTAGSKTTLSAKTKPATHG